MHTGTYDNLPENQTFGKYTITLLKNAQNTIRI